MGMVKKACITVILFTIGLAVAVVETASADQNSFSVQQCIDLALGKSVSIVSAKNARKAASYNLLDAWGDALPSAGIGASYGFNKDLKPTFVQDLGRYYQDPGTKSYNTRLDLSMTLFDGGRTWYKIKSNSLSKNRSEFQLTETELTTIFTVKQRYYTLLSSIMALKVAEDALIASKKQLEITNSRYELGSASLSEKLKQQVQVSSDSVGLIQSQNNINAAEFNLNLAMNRDVTLPIAPADTLGLVDLNMSLDQCTDMALKNNPTLAKSKLDYELSRTGVSIARAAWFPSVQASASWSWSTRHFTTVDSALQEIAATSTGRNYSFGISASYDIFNSFRKKTDYSRAQLDQQTAKASYDEEKNKVTEQVRQSHLDITKSKLQYQAALLGEESATEDLKLQQERYRLGASSILELLDAQKSLRQAQYTLIQALYDLNVALATIQQAMGQR